MYFRTAWRNILRTKGYSALNIAGLAIGMGVALLIGLWVDYQYSFDRSLPGYAQAGKILLRSDRDGEANVTLGTPLPLSSALTKDIPGIRYAAHSDWMGGHTLVVGNTKIASQGAMVEPDFLNIFQYPFLFGTPVAALTETYSIVLDETTARALFGTTDPLGRMIRLDNEHDLKVTGIMKDLPSNSSFSFHYLIPFAYAEANYDWIRYTKTNWRNYAVQTFISVAPQASLPRVEAQLQGIFKRYNPEDYQARHAEPIFKPLSHWRLYTEYKNGQEGGGFIDFVRIFSLIGILVLIIACINFTNMATARSEKRAREVGIRKVIGSRRRGLVIQFLVESLVITLLAAILALTLAQVVLPAFNSLTQSSISIPYGSPSFWGALAATIGITSLLAGSRPAFYLSSFRPIRVLKGPSSPGRTALPRKVLVIIQFTASVGLIISTLIIYRQVQYAKDRPTGYDNRRLVQTDSNSDLTRNFTALKHDLLQSGAVSAVTYASNPITQLWTSKRVDNWSGKLPGETLEMAVISTGDEDFFHTMGMQILQGRSFTDAPGVDSLNVILNEAAVRRMRFRNPLNQVLTWHETPQQVHVIGVVNDALISNPYAPVEPTIFIYTPGWNYDITYRLAPDMSTHDALAKIAPIFLKYEPSSPFKYNFVDALYATKFETEDLVGTLSGLFALLALFISCLGLFGLAAYMAERRTKEIGIRKVLGASVSNIWALLSREFVVLVSISCVCASVISFYFLQEWLHQYYYHISLGPGVFILAGAVAVLITLATVSTQSIRAALMKPASSLRTE